MCTWITFVLALIMYAGKYYNDDKDFDYRVIIGFVSWFKAVITSLYLNIISVYLLKIFGCEGQDSCILKVAII